MSQESLRWTPTLLGGEGGSGRGPCGPDSERFFTGWEGKGQKSGVQRAGTFREKQNAKLLPFDKR